MNTVARLFLEVFLVSLFVTGLMGCGAVESDIKAALNPSPSPSPTASTTTTTTNNPVVSPSPSPLPTVTLTVYSVTAEIEGVDNNATGMCANYQSNIYCWDDGVHENAYTFWNLTVIGNSIENCPPPDSFGNYCAVDALKTPTLMSVPVIGLLTGTYTPAYVFAHGTTTSVSCTENGALVNCGSFVINTAQVPR